MMTNEINGIPEAIRLSWSDTRRLNKERVDWMLEAARQQNGLAHYRFLWFDFFFVADPELIRELIVKRARLLHRDPFTSNVLGRIMGNGVFIAEDADWERQRKLVAPAFHAMRIRAYADIMADYAREMVGDWRDGEVRRLDNDLTQLTLRIIARTMFNVDLVEEAERIGRLMQDLLETGEAQLDSAYPPPNWVPTPTNRRQNAALKELHGLLREIIRERQASGRDEGDLLSMLIQARDERGQPMSERQIIDECVTLVTAGHETTAVALMWAWLALGREPAVTQRLYDEVDRVAGREAVTFERLADLPYTEAVVKETLRLYPPAFSFGRSPQGDLEFDLHDRVYRFKLGSTILFSTVALHRLPEFYPEPEAFRPERWLGDAPQPPKYAYLPFGAGPRVCLGNLFAMMEAQVILATMAQHVRLTPEPGVTMDWDPLITLRPRDPVLARVERR